MPIYEFKCLKCEEFFEVIVLNKDEELKCPKCKSFEFERVISSTNYSMGEKKSNKKQEFAQERKCSSGSCTTYTVPGLEK